MYLDQRQHYLEQVRYALQAVAYPIQLAVNSPAATWRWLRESVATRESLQQENARLRAAQRELELRAMRYEALARENGQLRGLREALPPVAARWLAAEIVSIQVNSLRQRLLLDRGAVNGVFRSQAVLDDKGLIGQTTHVGPWSAEVILITDPEHAVPVRIERTGLRTIAVGGGDTNSLALPYLPGNADIRSGDLLVTSGLGGVFPEGYPVARVTEVHRDAVQPLAQVRAVPLAHVETDTEVMLVWLRADQPAAPAAALNAAGELTGGNATLQPQPAPPKTAPAAPAAPAAAAAAAATPRPPAPANEARP
jgi:rod shape-determining protein MreC